VDQGGTAADLVAAPGDDPTVAALLDTIPVTAEHPRTVVDLPGGLTNRNLKVTTPSATVVVRIPGPGSELLEIDRDAEYRNSTAAAQAGVGPPVVHHRPGHGITVEFLPGRTLTDDDLHDPEILGLVATACRKLHAGPRFVSEFDMFAVQARYREIVATHGFRVPDRYDEFAPTVDRIRVALGTRETVPCHNDLLAGNLLAVPDGAGGEEVRIVDYEYSGNNDPCFELGNIWSEATLPRELLDVLIGAYYGRERPDQVARAQLFALMSQYGWTLWASIMDGSSTLDFDFWEWGMEKYERALATFDGPDLEKLLDAAGGVRGPHRSSGSPRPSNAPGTASGSATRSCSPAPTSTSCSPRAACPSFCLLSSSRRTRSTGSTRCCSAGDATSPPSATPPTRTPPQASRTRTATRPSWPCSIAPWRSASRCSGSAGARSC
jgi:thiamine kinase-like enzyme